MSDPILTTKLYIPPVRENGVARPRLTEKLREGVGRPGVLVLLSGPAGFGKTTLLSEFVAQLARPVAWVSLDEGDNDPMRFWAYVIAACQRVQDGVGAATLALSASPQPLPAEAIPASLSNELAGLECDLALVLDDLHAIHNEAIHTALTFLLDHLPEKLHLIVSTRVDPPWPLARWRARNRLVEVRTQELRFTRQEALAFLQRVMGLELSIEDAAALEERTEGWAAGLQLAGLSLQGRSDIAGFVKAFTGSHTYVAEYLVEEVLQRQPQEVQGFLLRTSILERMNASLCEAVSSCPNGQAVLADLHRANLFTVALDEQGEWFRYHHLWRNLLQARLRQELPASSILALHQRAAAWFEKAGMIAEAIEQALAGADYAHVARLIEKIGLPMILQAYVRTVENWLQAIPQEYIQHSQRINLVYAWLYLLRGPFEQAAPYLERLEALFAASGGDPALEGEWLAIQARLLSMQGRPAESRDLANRALQTLPAGDTHVRSMLLVNLATAYQQLLDYDHAIESFQMVIRSAQAIGDAISETLGISGQAQMYLLQGRLKLTFATAQEGIRRVEASRKAIPFSATLYGEIGQVYYHWRQFEQAKTYARLSQQASGQSGYSDPEIFYHIMLSRMFQTQGDWSAAAEEMRKVGELAQRVPPAMIREEIVSQQVRVALAEGRLAAAEELLGVDGFSFAGGLRFPELAAGGHITHPVGLLYNSALRILLFQSRGANAPANLKQGIELSARVLAGELQCRHIPIALETLLLRSQLYAALGDEAHSLAEVNQALELAEPEGFLSLFLEEGPPVARALATLAQRKSHDPSRRIYLQSLLAAFPGENQVAAQYGSDLESGEGEALMEPLTARELEILALIAAGDSNRMIAGKLVITVSAVKKHSANIYHKLNVSNRTQAAARARQLKLLPAA